MKKLLIILALLFGAAGLVSPVAHAQGGLFQGITFNSRGLPVGGAFVGICSFTATIGTASTPCSPLVTIYSDSALTQPIATNGNLTTPFSSDGLGNFQFYAPPGLYMAQYYGPRLNLTFKPIQVNGTGTGGITGGTTNYLAIFNSSTSVTASLCGVFGGVLVCNSPVDVQQHGYGIEKQNSASGTTCGLSVSLDASGNAITTVNGAVNGSFGVAAITQPGVDASGTAVQCGTSGNVFIGQLGNFALTFDNQTVINDYVTIGANGKFHDAGATEPTGVQVIGRVTSANAGAGTNANVDIFTGDSVGANGVRGTLCEINGSVVSGTQCNFNATTPAAAANFQNLPWATDNATPTSNVSVSAPQATTGQAGLIKLAGDIANGTYLLPTVTGIQTIPVTFTSPSARDVICFPTSSTLANCPLGVPVRTVAGNSDTITTTDRVTDVRYTAASGATAVTIAQAGSAGFAFNFPTLLTNAQGSGAVTLTPATSTINGNANLAIQPGFWCFVYSDNTNYFANCGQINGGGAGGGGSSSVFIENLTPDTSGLVLWTVDPSTNFRDGYWDWSNTIASATSLYGKIRIPHVLPAGTAKIILSQLAANDATAGHTMTFKVCTITVTTTLHVGAPTCTATQNFTTTTTAYGPMDLTFSVPVSLSIDTQLDVVITATTESGLVADVQMEGVSFQWE